ncbi:hypothetical protein [Goodfellowiella coeruleoviolacea]|uniref:Uncharacterized protein n=1 Tax=Goodfellowiella coeruleoviolacea TaxID=334858 RepID=A0AAE3GCQ9_9PSEU|nr:hypothetical protein [Goodfellowiella coeruleoviolacea]MCP2164759.1 hypothetical protein [Goodfellowiella coeruleoviolacea]
MDTGALADAYTGLTRAADALAGPAAADVPAAAWWTLAHVALSDELIAATAEQVRAGQPAALDNAPAMAPAAIAELTARPWPELVGLVRRNAERLLAVLREIPDERAGAASVRTRLVDRDGNQVFAGEINWAGLVRARAEEHLPGHAARLTALAGRPPARPARA